MILASVFPMQRPPPPIRSSTEGAQRLGPIHGDQCALRHMLEVERETAIGSVTFLDPTLGRPTYLSAKPITSASMPTSVMRAIRLKKELPRRWRSSHCELGLQRG